MSGEPSGGPLRVRPPFLEKHMKAGLLEHESLFTPDFNPIKVAPLKVDGTKRIKKTFPDGAVITFPK